MKKAAFITIIASAGLILAASKWLGQQPSGGLGGCSFYYWKTNLKFTKADKSLADSVGMKRLYLRYFDVDWSPSLGMPVPVGQLRIQEDWEDYRTDNHSELLDYQVVPTVYIVNSIFEKDINVDSLSEKITSLVNAKTETLASSLYSWGYDYENAEVDLDTLWEKDEKSMAQFKERIAEIQMDCDWTPATRSRYFSFLVAIQKANPSLKISCTIRLHQYRDREQAGIPPVSRGTLMCYNFGAPKDSNTRDAIFDPDLAEGYLKNGDYPLPLEAALPLFSWGALFHEGKFKGLAAGLSERDVKGNPLFESVADGQYRFTQDTVFAEVYMRKGDIVRLDEPSPDELANLAKRLASNKAVKTISFFDWNPSKIREYHVEEICKNFQAGR